MRIAVTAAALLTTQVALAQTPTPTSTPVLLVVGTAGAASVVETEEPFTGWGVFVDEDAFFPPKNLDRNYTLGFGARFNGRFVEDWFIDRPLDWIDLASGASEFRRARLNGRRIDAHSLMIGVTAFTPDLLEDRNPIHTDRPYSSMVFASVSRTTAYTVRSEALRSELTVGLMGLGEAGDIQTEIHRWLKGKRCDVGEPLSDCPGPRHPMGWRHQIGAGGELTGKYTVTYLRQLGGSSEWIIDWDSSMLLEGSLGYYTNAAAGGMLRMGLIESPFWQADSNPLGLVSQVDRREYRRYAPEVYAFVAGRWRAVAYNVLLQGQFRESEVRLKPNEVERVVGEGETGVRIGYGGWAVTVSLLGRTAEHTAGPARDHIWLGGYLTYVTKAGDQAREK